VLAVVSRDWKNHFIPCKSFKHWQFAILLFIILRIHPNSSKKGDLLLKTLYYQGMNKKKKGDHPMAVIAQKQIFSWTMVDVSSDLRRLELVLSSIPDEALMRKLELERKGRRDDNPIRSLWNSLLAGIVFEHEKIEHLRRELLRNGELREVCGFEVVKCSEAVPSSSAYSRFMKKLIRNRFLIEKMLDDLVAELCKLLPDFGSRLAIDSKKLESYSVSKQDPSKSSDPDADWGCKTYKGVRKDGTLWEQVKRWFGYKLHLIVDSIYELPVAFEVTNASVNDSPRLIPMIERLKEHHPELLEQTEYLTGDKGYDSAKNNGVLWDNYGIKPVIDTRSMWTDEPEKPRSLLGDFDNIFYNEKGKVLCRRFAKENESDNYCPMAFEGFEKNRDCLKFRCPAAAYGLDCEMKNSCKNGADGFGRIVRVPLDFDRRIFTPLYRSSYKWKREYKHRTAVERVNSRIDTSFGFENHNIRGLKKMRCKVGIALVVMLAMAVGRIKANQIENIRSLVKKAA